MDIEETARTGAACGGGRKEWSGAPRPGPPHGGPSLPSGKLLLPQVELEPTTLYTLDRALYH